MNSITITTCWKKKTSHTFRLQANRTTSKQIDNFISQKRNFFVLAKQNQSHPYLNSVYISSLINWFMWLKEKNSLNNLKKKTFFYYMHQWNEIRKISFFFLFWKKTLTIFIFSLQYQWQFGNGILIRNVRTIWWIISTQWTLKVIQRKIITVDPK